MPLQRAALARGSYHDELSHVTSSGSPRITQHSVLESIRRPNRVTPSLLYLVDNTTITYSINWGVFWAQTASGH